MPGSNTYKVTWHFSGPLGVNFNEIYYTTGNVPTDAWLVPTQAAQGRLWLLHPDYQLFSISASDVANPRSVAQRTVNWVGTNPNYTYGSAPPQTALVCSLSGTTGGSRKLWMRGLPLYIVGNLPGSGRSAFGGLTLDNFNLFIQGMAAFPFGIRKLTATTKCQISSITPSQNAGQSLVTYTVPAGSVAPTWVVGSQALFGQSDQKTLPGLKGKFTILNIGVNTITIRYQCSVPAGVTTNCGYVRQVTFASVIPFSAANSKPVYWGSHDTKVFARASRGAKRAVRIRTLA